MIISLGMFLIGWYLYYLFQICFVPDRGITVPKMASTISAAYQLVQNKYKNVPPHFGSKELLPYLKYSKLDTNSTFQVQDGGEALQSCSEKYPCLHFQKGILQYDAEQQFNGNTDKNALYFNFDPDGISGYGGITLVMYYNGRMTTGENMVKDHSETIINSDLKFIKNDPPYYHKEW